MEAIRPSKFRALTSAPVALSILTEVRALSPDSATIALIENRRDRLGIAIPVEGGEAGPEQVLTLDDLLLRTVGDDDACRLVLATVRATLDDVVAERDLGVWRRLVANHEGRSCRLIDWFLLDGAGVEAHSFAEIAGPPPRW